MDIFEFSATKVVKLDGVFESFKDEEGDLGGIFTRLNKLMISENHIKWDIAYLETYIGHLMVPRSFRWDVAPQKGDTDLEEWFEYFNQAGVSFLCFLVERKATKLVKLDDEIKLIKEKLNPIKEGEEYMEKSQSLLKVLEKEDKDQRAKKKKKYNRDLIDYHGNLVFNWQKKLLEEQAKAASSDMDISVPPVGGGGGSLGYSQAQSAVPKQGPPNPRMGGNNSYQSPRRGFSGVRGGPLQGYSGRPLVANGPGPQYQGPPSRPRGQPPRGRGWGHTTHRGRGSHIDHSEGWRQGRNSDWDPQSPFFYQSGGASGWDFNVPVQTSFFPLRDGDGFDGDWTYENTQYPQP